MTSGFKIGTFTPKNPVLHPRFFALLEAFRGPVSACRNPAFEGRHAWFHYKGLNKK